MMKHSEKAQSELVEAEKELGRVTASGPLAVTPEMVRPYINSLRAEMLLRAGQHDEGARILKEVQLQIRAAPGADAWIQALFRLESIARTARDTGNWELAEFTAKQMHSHDSSYAGTHYALAFVADHKGETETARSMFGTAAKLWARADADLPELQHARRSSRHPGSR
jgi:hypothetical protein